MDRTIRNWHCLLREVSWECFSDTLWPKLAFRGIKSEETCGNVVVGGHISAGRQRAQWPVCMSRPQWGRWRWRRGGRWGATITTTCCDGWVLLLASHSRSMGGSHHQTALYHIKPHHSGGRSHTPQDPSLRPPSPTKPGAVVRICQPTPPPPWSQLKGGGQLV